MASENVENQVTVFVQLLKMVQKDLIELNLSPEKALEIWSLGISTFKEYRTGFNSSLLEVRPGVTIKKSDIFQGGI